VIIKHIILVEYTQTARTEHNIPEFLYQSLLTRSELTNHQTNTKLHKRNKNENFLICKMQKQKKIC